MKLRDLWRSTMPVCLISGRRDQEVTTSTLDASSFNVHDKKVDDSLAALLVCVAILRGNVHILFILFTSLCGRAESWHEWYAAQLQGMSPWLEQSQASSTGSMILVSLRPAACSINKTRCKPEVRTPHLDWILLRHGIADLLMLLQLISCG